MANILKVENNVKIDTNMNMNTNNDNWISNSNNNNAKDDSDIDINMSSQTENSESSVYGSHTTLSDDDNWDTFSAESVPKKVMTFPPKTNDILNGYRLEKKVKFDENAVVFICHSIRNRRIKYFTKIGVNKEESRLKKEYKNYLRLEGGEGIPKLISNHWWTEGSGDEWNCINWGMIVIEKLNYTLISSKPILNQKHRLELKQLVPIALQQISLLEFVHSKGLTHRGVKPDNFVESRNKKKVYIIDFNRSKTYLNMFGNHFDYQRDNKPPKGNPLFHSLNYHNGVRRSRRDDMESLGLCWVYQLKGELPWSLDFIERRKFKTEQYIREIATKVRQTTIEDLCEGLPQNFKSYFEMCREMSFKDKPNYDQMRRLIENSINENLINENSIIESSITESSIFDKSSDSIISDDSGISS